MIKPKHKETGKMRTEEAKERIGIKPYKETV
jgi:hypothetical protein